MQLADNPITKIIFEKLKRKDFKNLHHLIFDEKRSSEFQYELLDFKVDITRQSLDKEIKKDLKEKEKKQKIAKLRKTNLDKKLKIKGESSSKIRSTSSNESLSKIDKRNIEVVDVCTLIKKCTIAIPYILEA